MRAVVLLGLLLTQPATAWAEWQFKPFIGVSFGGTNSFVVLDQDAGKHKWVVGGAATWLGNVVGVEGEIARVPGFFETDGQQSVLSSSVTTLTGNVVLTLPKRLTQYGLRPYVVGGGGVVRVAIDQGQVGNDLLDIHTSLGVLDIGGGATGFLTDRVGLSWDVRYFRSVGGKEDTGLTIGKEQISFWRASMGVAIRLGAGR